jgi:hypothetical protein
MNTVRRRIHKASELTVLLSLVIAMAIVGVARADDKKPSAQPAVSENISLNSVHVQTSYSTGEAGPSVSLNGVLHLVSQTLLSADGTPFAFTLHTNLADVDASTADGEQSFVAVGAFALPVECESGLCPPQFWNVTFRLVPEKAALQSSLFLALTLNTKYTIDGYLSGSCVFGTVGCTDFPD